ncbi:endonuclease/exonuclease/phosphatase family protein [Streptomyces sp. NBC_00102]|uniref:endonuclease/exonuclease/phosphatase family protein n=1 Tax=Streptomyces sp. NBC_00102 TaxID=2975652 RepID=UPI0022596B21|nr:endonuclease/exonuclease/phosphatase family protein [Streptomyces sp. NBC_00102]MCX5395694.1 endonuclease/exonuclease/phosphatase family protein [Streptomyces sp. NBC_00102]
MRFHGIRRRGVRLVLAGALAGVLLPVTASAQAEAASPRTYTVWQWNVAGDTIHEGSTTDGLIDQAASSMVNRAADFASLNELCQGQYNALVTALRAKDWPADPQNFARFEPSRQAGNSSVCKGEAFGNALFSKKPLGTAARLALPDDGTAEKRNMLCAPLTDGTATRFCTTHITTNQSFNVAQLDYVRQRLEDYHAAGETVLIAGDFNAQPNYGRLNPFYAPSLDVPNNGNNTGAYRELDDNDTGHCIGYGEWTSEGTPGSAPPCGGNAKIDLIFARESTLAGPYSGDSLDISTSCTGVAACSDHRTVIGTVTVA